MKQRKWTLFGRTPLKLCGGVVLLLAIIALPIVRYGYSEAVQLGFRHLQLSDSTAGATDVNYEFGFKTNTSGTLGSIAFEVCENYQYDPGDPCTMPIGFSAAGVSLTAQSGAGDFVLSPSSTGSKLLITRPAATNVSPSPQSITFSGITNPSNIGSYYVRIATFASTDGSGPETDFGVVVFATNLGVNITTEVPPYLMFCTGITIDGFNCGTAQGSFINFGELSSRATRAATSQMLASTNAPYGYSVTLAGATMTAGTNVIPAMNGSPSQIGTSQFGINGRFNSSPSVGSDPDGPGLTMPGSGYNSPNIFKFASGDIIASSNTTDDYRKMTVSYIVNTAPGQSPGRYVATVSYICLANF